MPDIESFKAFLNEHCQILEKLAKDTKQADKQNASKNLKDKTKANSLAHLMSNAIKCTFCKGSHNIYLYKEMLELPVDKRLAQVKKLKL